MTDPSQHKEATWIWENIVPTLPPSNTRRSFFEVGAFSGLQSSNTLLFENMGWHGALVEADPYLAGECINNRPDCITWCCAASSHPGTAKFNVNHADRGLSGLSAEGRPISVLLKTLEYLITASDLGVPTLLSIDTEGTELDVWDSIGTLRPQIVIMEYRTGNAEPQDVPIIARMAEDGYTLRHTTPCNLIFTR